MIRFDWELFMRYILGTNNYELFAAATGFLLLGFFISVGMRVAKGIRENPNTPDKFNLWYLLYDKRWELIVGFVMACAIMRFAGAYAGDKVLIVAGALGFLNYELSIVFVKGGRAFLGRINDLISTFTGKAKE